MFKKKVVRISLVSIEVLSSYLVGLVQILFFNPCIICHLARSYNTLVLSEKRVFHIVIL